MVVKGVGANAALYTERHRHPRPVDRAREPGCAATYFLDIDGIFTCTSVDHYSSPDLFAGAVTMSIARFDPIGDCMTVPMPECAGAAAVLGAPAALGLVAGAAPGATADLPMPIGVAAPVVAVDFGIEPGAGATALPTGAATCAETRGRQRDTAPW